MQLPSISEISHLAVRTFRRFSFSMIAAAAGTYAALTLSAGPSESQALWAYRVLFAALPGFALLTGLVLLAEKRKWGRVLATGIQAAGALLCLLYAWTLPEDIPDAPALHAMRLAMLSAAMYLFIAFAPWMDRNDDNSFWQFNRVLIVRLFIAGLSTLVLYAGLALALAAMEQLFELRIPDERYLQLYFLLVGLFLTSFFLAGVPENLDAPDWQNRYPEALKVFSQYVLLPLVGIYFFILLAYSGKIILSWTWPYGWVSRLILGFSAAGIVSILLLHPLRSQIGTHWITRSATWFWTALLPLLVLYFFAVLRRVSEYGLTESRYLGIAAGVWLAGMALYFLLSRGKNIRVIPFSLSVLTLLIAIGPWSAFAVSERSQTGRLERLLETNGLLENGTVRPAERAIPQNDAGEIHAIINYLYDVHGYAAIEHWFESSVRADRIDEGEWLDADTITSLLGIETVSIRKVHPDDDLRYDAARSSVLEVRGYDYALPELSFSRSRREWTKDEAAVSCSVNEELDTLTFIYAPAGEADETLRIPLGAVRDSLFTLYGGFGARNVPEEMMVITVTNERMKVKVHLLQLQLRHENGDPQTEYLRVRVLYSSIDRPGDVQAENIDAR